MTAEKSSRRMYLYERRRRWSPELQRQFERDDVHIRAFASTADLESALAVSLPDAILLALEDAEADCLQLLVRLLASPRYSPVIVVGSRRTVELEWSIRESGVAAFVLDTSTGEDLARLCRRQWSPGRKFPGN